VRKDHAKALANFLLAGQQGHTLALYNLGVMYANGLGSPRSCRTALMYFKAVAERASWTKALGEAQKLHRAGDSEGALLVYERFAEMGFEVAQSNAAYLLRKLHPSPTPAVLQRISRLLTRASLQGSLDATVRLGDMYYSGEGAPLDLTKAASLYQKAAGSKNPEAMFNLGAMHHFGLGLPKDLHLAKRFYDMAGATSDEASVPVALALASLRVATFIETFEYKGLKWDDCAIVALSISTFALIMTRILRLRGFFS
jgi:SEL1 protein